MHLNRQQRRAAARSATPGPGGPPTTVLVRVDGPNTVAITLGRPLEHGGPATVTTSPENAEQIAAWLTTAAANARRDPHTRTAAPAA